MSGEDEENGFTPDEESNFAHRHDDCEFYGFY